MGTCTEASHDLVHAILSCMVSVPIMQVQVAVLESCQASWTFLQEPDLDAREALGEAVTSDASNPETDGEQSKVNGDFVSVIIGLSAS